MDDAAARRRMVDGQLRPNRVSDSRIIEAMLELPRQRFLPAALASRSYLDEDVRLPRGRALLAPMTLARLVQLAAVRADDRVLVAGSGVGYGAALLVRLGARVVALEDDPALLAIARSALSAGAGAGSWRIVEGSPAAGWPPEAPYDVVLIEGAVPELPEPLAAQLAEGGRLVAVLRRPGEAGVAVLGRRVGGTFSTVEAFGATAPLVPAFVPAAGFVF